MTKCLEKAFALSSPEDRRKVTGVVGKLWDLGGDHHKFLDRYIAVLAFKNTLIVSGAVGVATTIIFLIIIHDLNKTPVSLDLAEVPLSARQVGFVSLQAYIHSLLMGYSIFFLSPLYFLLFLINVKKDEIDIYRYDPVLKNKKNRTTKKKVIRFLIYLAALPLGYIMSFSSYSALAHLVRWGDPAKWGDSYILLLSNCAFNVIAHAFAAALLYMGMILAYGLLAGFCSKK